MHLRTTDSALLNSSSVLTQYLKGELGQRIVVVLVVVELSILATKYRLRSLSVSLFIIVFFFNSSFNNLSRYI